MIKYILTILSVVFIQLVSAQIINEDYLEILSANAAPLWNNTNPAFNTSTVPEKYKTSSAVIIGYQRELSIDKQSKAKFLKKAESSLLFFENTRFKIKLLDRNAVKTFTEFYFRYGDKADGFAAKVTKKDGLTTTVQLDAAVAIERNSSVPEFFKSFFDEEYNSRNRYYKVAIPDLETGDMLEYVSITKSKLDVSSSGLIEFTPQYELCAKPYPILFNQIAIETDDKSFFKSLSKNGAPVFKKENATNADFYRFVFTDNDRPIEKDINFINSYKQLPFTKFQVIYSNNENAKGTLIGTKGEIKSNFTKEELALKSWEDFNSIGQEYYNSGIKGQTIVDNFWKEFRKLGAKDWSDKEYIEKVYYRLRYWVVNREDYLADKVFAYIFGSLLFQKDIKSELIISVSNSIGNLDDIIFENEIKYITKVGNNLYYNITNYSNPGELKENLLGSNAYIIEAPDKKTKVQNITPYKLPDLAAADNISDEKIEVSLNTDMSTMSVKRVSKYTNIFKNRNIADALAYTIYWNNDYKYYGGDNPTDKLNGTQLDQYETSFKTLKTRYIEQKEQYVKSELQKEFGKKVKFKKFTVDSDGRSKNKTDLLYTEEFEIENVTKKAGKKYLLSLTALVGGQLQFKKEERVRNNDIDLDYARSISWNINFKIPTGYKVEGLTEITKKIDNEIGTYECVATEANGIVNVLIKKVYKKANFPKSKWPDMLQFIDTAFDNSYKNILLKPIN
jgi:hypothetical protein